ncbi:MAG TPA: alpha/beta hydrolase [Caulobacteraceae bacterium]|nr:alpha/beta hydrolase [Caulobacteraceae bacterium]
MKPPPVVMVHGAFCGGWVFEGFAEPFVAAGHETHCLDLRAGAAVAGLSMSDYARRVAAFAETLKAPPVLIGHSLGGLVCLLGAAQVRTAGVVLLAPSAPWGVVASTMEEAVSAVALYALGPYWALAIEPEYATFGRYAVNRLPRPERHALFGRMGAESGRALFETLNWWLDPFMTTLARPERIDAPILALSGERDAIHPPLTVAETARRVGAEHVVMEGMSHWLPAEPGWEAVADRCLAWLGAAATPLAAE